MYKSYDFATGPLTLMVRPIDLTGTDQYYPLLSQGSGPHLIPRLEPNSFLRQTKSRLRHQLFPMLVGAPYLLRTTLARVPSRCPSDSQTERALANLLRTLALMNPRTDNSENLNITSCTAI